MLTGNWLSKTCAAIEDAYDVVITDYARGLILQSVVALRADPHPGWGDARPSDDEVKKRVREQLSDLARQVAERPAKIVTYFDVLHHLVEGCKGWPVAKR
ncbi:hypothetical protein MWN34_07680 [Ancylobacter sp. 6x-1]|uniref:Uncharacterized protein n=1 Tax=Ancylobacter crimeensis TaxID=2579147 RepID=A0ABT0DA13_9HYPH|nr:hypothetical protein [Ancylobacter crimeensis]MCK0196793.1 hypothetical protein [Ancylobacter crimeensis]